MFDSRFFFIFMNDRINIDVEFHCKMRQNTFEETKHTAQRMLFQLNYLSRAFFYVSSFNFYSLFSLQILRFVYSLLFGVLFSLVAVVVLLYFYILFFNSCFTFVMEKT